MSSFHNLSEFNNYIEPLIKELMKDTDFSLDYEEIMMNRYQEYEYHYVKETSIGPHCTGFFLNESQDGYKLEIDIFLYLKLPEFNYYLVPYIQNVAPTIKGLNGSRIIFPITALMPKEAGLALETKMSNIRTKTDADETILAVNNALLAFWPLLNGNIENLVLIIKQILALDGLVRDKISYLFAFRLANDAEFDNLVNDSIVDIRKSFPLLEKDFLAFVKFLREEVKPLV